MNSTESPSVLTTRPPRRATTSWLRPSKTSTRSPISSSSSRLVSALKLTRSANPTVASATCLVDGAVQALDPRHRGQQVPPPDVGEQLLEVRPDRLDQAERLGALGGLGAGLVEHRRERGHLPLGEPVHGLPDRPGHPHDGVEVELAVTLDGGHARERLGVGLAEARRPPAAGSRARARAAAPAADVSPAAAATSSPVSSGIDPRMARSRSSGSVIGLVGAGGTARR